MDLRGNTKLDEGYIYPSVIPLYKVDRSHTYALEEGRKTNGASPKLRGASMLLMFLEIPMEKP